MATELLATGALVTVVVTMSKVIEILGNKLLKSNGGNGQKPESPPPLVTSNGRGPTYDTTGSLPPWYERLARIEARADAQDTRFEDIIGRFDSLNEKLDHLLMNLPGSRSRD